MDADRLPARASPLPRSAGPAATPAGPPAAGPGKGPADPAAGSGDGRGDPSTRSGDGPGDPAASAAAGPADPSALPGNGPADISAGPGEGPADTAAGPAGLPATSPVPAAADRPPGSGAPGASGSTTLSLAPPPAAPLPFRTAGPATRPGRTVRRPIMEWKAGRAVRRSDELATEEPLEIRVVLPDGGRPAVHPVAVTMRTPGNDFELAAGFLYSEGVIAGPQAIGRIAYCTDPDQPQQYNAVNVTLRPGVAFDPARLSRHVFTSSSCGVCGKASLDQVTAACPAPLAPPPPLSADLLLSLPAALRRDQAIFARTGGLHATALFSAGGTLQLLREDVGRHNALDKAVGAALLAGRLPLHETIALVSGRTSFEVIQKALMAGISVVAAVGAPSSLAVDLARAAGMTLIGFLREERFNVYAGSVDGVGAASS